MRRCPINGLICQNEHEILRQNVVCNKLQAHYTEDFKMMTNQTHAAQCAKNAYCALRAEVKLILSELQHEVQH